MDARYEKVRVNNMVVSQGVLIVAGVDDSGRRRVLDLLLTDSESEISWREIFDRLKDGHVAQYNLGEIPPTLPSIAILVAPPFDGYLQRRLFRKQGELYVWQQSP